MKEYTNYYEEVHFSRLLKIYKKNKSNAFIIELKIVNIDSENKKTIKKEIYNSFNDDIYNQRRFQKLDKKELKKMELSNHCLMSECIDGSCMFFNFNITHFEADCSSLVCGNDMFYSSDLSFIRAKFPVLKNGHRMFSCTKIKEININFPKLENGNSMFYECLLLRKFKGNIPSIKTAVGMFMWDYSLEEFEENSKMKLLKERDKMFSYTSRRLKEEKPFLFV